MAWGAEGSLTEIGAKIVIGGRDIPMTANVISKNERPLQPGAVNNVLYNIVDAYNRQEAVKAKREHRKSEMTPGVSLIVALANLIYQVYKGKKK